ncbi:hypothetical protein ABZ635_16950 [Nocardiopsis sp. NPDC007018]|uniref:WXG100 family type VII secretion target n=1 Tax=Nocardiopsis sp. NPDC007018 TaxID=3155721 RepID=UPI00340D1853
MSVNKYEVGADIDQLDELSADQRHYLGLFQAIMQEIDGQAKETVSRFEGGNEAFQARAAEFTSAFEMTNRGFSKMIDAVDGTVDGYRDTKRYLDNLFE